MQIQYNGGKIAHVPNDIGRALIDAKLAVEVKPPAKPVPNTTWEVRQGLNPEHGPYLAAHCSTCGQNACSGGPKTSQTMKFLHCGIVENVPQYVARNYDKQYRDWQRGDESRPSSVSASQRDIERARIEWQESKR